jgi:hypothetical protein
LHRNLKPLSGFLKSGLKKNYRKLNGWYKKDRVSGFRVQVSGFRVKKLEELKPDT